MKTKTLKLFVIIVFYMITKQINATSYNVIYMDSISSDYDTISICKSSDSIKVVPMHGVNGQFWFGDNIDTIYQDTLYLKSGYSGLFTCQGFSGQNWQGRWVNVTSLIVQGYDKEISCGDRVNLNVTTNFSGNGNVQYKWSPSEGLSDSTISNPTVSVEEDMKYLVSVTTSEGCSASTNISVTLKKMNTPNICIVSIDSTNKNVIYWEKPVSTSIDSFYIYKETSASNVYNKIGSVGYKNTAEYLDLNSNPDIQSNRYKVSIKDVCSLESDPSNSHKTIHLTINQGQNSSWNLIWEAYEGINVSTYYIYRGTNSNNLELIGSTTASSSQYTDFSAPAGIVYYQIEIVSTNSCNNSTKKKQELETIITSRSNIATNKSTIVQSSSSNSFSIYPNPVEEILHIVSNQNSTEDKTIEIYSVDGKIVEDRIIKSTQKEINLGNLKEGLYILKILTGSDYYVQEIIKK